MRIIGGLSKGVRLFQPKDKETIDSIGPGWPSCSERSDFARKPRPH